VADFYELLGVEATASTAQIRKAYLRLAREKHPDRFTDPAERERAQALFQDITAAFNTLSNEQGRAEYDESRQRPRPTTPEEIARDAFERSTSLVESGQLEQALTLLRTAVHHGPDRAEYHAALGRLLSRDASSAREAIQSLERATQLDPRDAAAFADLAILQHRQGLHLRAQRSLEAARRIGPSNPRVVAALSELGGAGS